MIKRTRTRKRSVVKVEAAAAEAVKPVTVKVEASLLSVVLEFVSPAARWVLVAASFGEREPEPPPLIVSGDAQWTCNLKVGPGRYENLFVVGGQWLPKPNTTTSTQNSFRGIDSALTLSF